MIIIVVPEKQEGKFGEELVFKEIIDEIFPELKSEPLIFKRSEKHQPNWIEIISKVYCNQNDKIQHNTILQASR